MSTGGLGLLLTPPPESVTIRTVFFDNSERIVVQGEHIQETLRSLIRVYGKRPWNRRVIMNMGVTVASKVNDVPVSAVGTTNYKPLQLVDPSELSPTDRELGASVACQFLLGSV
jgi:hypothetical protein